MTIRFPNRGEFRRILAITWTLIVAVIYFYYREVPDWMVSIVSTVITFYFATKSSSKGE